VHFYDFTSQVWASKHRHLRTEHYRCHVCQPDIVKILANLQEQRKGLKAQRRAALSGKALQDDFADDVAELVAATEGGCANQEGTHNTSREDCSK